MFGCYASGCKAPTYPATLASRANLAAGYLSGGHVERAISLYDLNLTDRERVVGPDLALPPKSHKHVVGAMFRTICAQPDADAPQVAKRRVTRESRQPVRRVDRPLLLVSRSP